MKSFSARHFLFGHMSRASEGALTISSGIRWQNFLVEWKKAMNEKILALKENQTWDLVPKPEEVKPISCKWVAKNSSG